MTSPRETPQRRDPARLQRVVLATSAAEYAAIHAQADRAGLSLSNFLRRCINGYLLDEGIAAMLPELKRGGWTAGDRVT